MAEEKVEGRIEVVKKPYSKEKIGVTVMLVGLTAAIFLAIGYWAGTQSSELQDEATTDETCPIDLTSATATVSPATSPVAIDETASWKTYTNEEYGFSFKYPGDWTITNDNPGGTQQTVNQNLTLSGKDSEEFIVWVNPDGFGLEGASDRYIAKISEGKINVTSKEQNQPNDATQELVGQVFISNLTTKGINYVIAYNFDIDNRLSELETFDQILSTFQFTK